MTTISTETTAKVADLAKLKLSDVELEKFTKEMSDILGFVEQLNEVDTDDIGIVSHIDDFQGARLRSDEPADSLVPDAAFLNATDGRNEDDYFITRKVL